MGKVSIDLNGPTSMPEKKESLLETIPVFPGRNDETPWRLQIEQSITTPQVLSSFLGKDLSALETTVQTYPLRITPYYLSLIIKHGAPLYRQAVPDERELACLDHSDDPLGEEPSSPVPHLIHRYPDRVVLLLTNACATYCRHCMRKRMIGGAGSGRPLHPPAPFPMEKAIQYIHDHPAVDDIILSGGDPFMLGTEALKEILTRLSKISHVETLRIHTRIPATLPHRITRNLVATLKTVKPLFINIQFNHPLEITQAAREACDKLADAGIPLGSQTVLLKGVNDDAATLKRLFKTLLSARVRPYYLHHPDPVKGTAHFRPSVKKGLDIMQQLRGNISGMCIPHYMIDLPGGGGKIPLSPGYVLEKNESCLVVRNYQGDRFLYPDGQ